MKDEVPPYCSEITNITCKFHDTYNTGNSLTEWVIYGMCHTVMMSMDAAFSTLHCI